MEIIVFGPIWGMTDPDLRKSLTKLKDAGYQGAEIALNPETDDLHGIKEIFDDLCMRMIAQHPFSRGDNPQKFKADYTSKLLRIAQIGPEKINCHTGKDYFSTDENLGIIESAEKISADLGIPVLHEIHRGRFSFSPSHLGEYLKRFPELRLTADFSHWCVVSESLLEDMEDFIDWTVPHCQHIHARVGNSQSAQVTHPAAPENREALDRHTAWWQKIFSQHTKDSRDEFTVTCEFGPAPYLPSLPFTNQPVASQWELNLFMKDYIIEKFKVWKQDIN